VFLAWHLAFGLLVLFRMFLVGNDEIVPQDFDSVYYSQMASHYFSGNAFSILPTHRPGVSLLAWVGGQFGIPYKLIVDALLVGLAIASAIVLRSLTRSRLFGFVVAAAILFHPWLMVHSQLAMTEPLTSLLLLGVLLTAIPFVVRPAEEWPLGVTLAACLFTSVHVLTRSEFPLLLGFYLVIGAVAWFRAWRNEKIRSVQEDSPARPVWRRPGGWRFVLIVLPILAAWCATQGIKRMHESRFQVSATCATEADGFVDLMSALYSIKPDQDELYVPVTRASLAKACQVSQVMQMVSDPLLDRSRGAYRICQRVLGVEGEVGPWLNWHLVDCFGGVDRNANNRMRVAARQIREAQGRGELEKRSARFPIDPMWQSWLPRIPAKFARAVVVSLVDFHLQYDQLFDRRRLLNPVATSMFDQGMLRRQGIGRDLNVWVFAQAVRQQAVSVVAARLLGDDDQLIVQVPVVRNETGNIQFAISVDASESDLLQGELSVQLVIGEQAADSFPDTSQAIALEDFARNEAVKFQIQRDGGETRELDWLLSVNRTKPPNLVRRWLRARLVAWPWIGFAAVFAFGFIVGWRVGFEPRSFGNLGWVAFVGWAFLLGRCFFYTLIDSWLAWGLHRYVEPNVFVALFSAAVLGCCLGGRLTLSAKTNE